MSSPTMKATPTKLNPFSCDFEDRGTEDEVLVVKWDEPQDDMSVIKREERFLVGSQVMLEVQTDVNAVPYEHLEASLRMGSLLAGTGGMGVQLGTAEFFDMMVAQDTKNFQTIVGTTKIDTITPRPDLNIEGLIYDVTFKRGTGSDRKTITTDVKTVSDYKSGLNRYFFGAMCVPGWVEKSFASFKKSNLDEAKRQQVIVALPDAMFWI